MSNKLAEELKRFHTPNSDKTRRIFLDYLKVDVQNNWNWNNFSQEVVKKRLDTLVIKRGEAAHRAKSGSLTQKEPDLIKVDELRKSISFLKTLVEKTDEILEENSKS